MRIWRVVGVGAFALGVVGGLAREARAADDTGTLVYCDAAAAIPPALTIGALFFSVGLVGPEGKGQAPQTVGASVPYTFGAGAATYALCAPIVHAANGRPLAAVGSLAVRLGSPLAGAALVYGSYRAFDDGWTTVLVGLAAIPGSFGLAILADYFFFTPPGGEPGSKPKPNMNPAPKPSTAAWSPIVAPTRGGASGGLAVVF